LLCHLLFTEIYVCRNAGFGQTRLSCKALRLLPCYQWPLSIRFHFRFWIVLPWYATMSIQSLCS
jgi:hypothetical protein